MVNNQRDRSRERACEDYVKAIYHLTGEAPVRAAELARYLGVSRASVSQSRRVLAEAGLVKASKGRTDTLRLTAKGLALGVRMARRHRLIETFLHRTLMVPLDRVHADAERIEHAISDDITGRLAEFLGNPTMDPHGHPIPSASSHGYGSAERRLVDVEPGESIVIVAIDDRDKNVVRYLDARAVLPGMRAVVARKSARSVTLRVGRKLLAIPARAARQVRFADAGLARAS